MSRQLEAYNEAKSDKRRIAILEAVDGGLEAAIRHAGGEFTGFAAKYRGEDCLLILKAVLPGGPQVAFVGASDLGDALCKAVREAKGDRLRWKPDQYSGPVALD